MANILTLTSLPEGSKTGDYIKATKSTQGLIQGEVYVVLDVADNVVVHISSDNFDPSILTGETIFYDGTKDKSIKAAIDLKANLLADVVEINSSFELKEEHSGKIIICNNSDPISITLDSGIAITSGRAINCLVLRHNADVEFVDELSVSLKSIAFNELVHVIQDGSHWHLWGTEDNTGLNPSDIDTVSLSDSDSKVPSSKLMAQLLSELPSGEGVQILGMEFWEEITSAEVGDTETELPILFEINPGIYSILNTEELYTNLGVVVEELTSKVISFTLFGDVSHRFTIFIDSGVVADVISEEIVPYLPHLSKSQVEDDQDDTFGLVSGERLAQAIAKHGGGGGGDFPSSILEVSEDFASLLVYEGEYELDAALYPECREILEKTPDYLLAVVEGVPSRFPVRYFTVYSDDSAALGVDSFLVAEIEGQGDGQRFISHLRYSRLEGSFESGEIITIDPDGSNLKSYLNTVDITSEVLSGLQYRSPNSNEVGREEALPGGIFYKFDTSATGAYSIQIKQSNLDTVMSFAGEGGVGASEISFYAPFQSHSSSYLQATWAGCTLSGATLLTSGN